MKKTMIFTLILMPLIVLGILLLSGNIVNMSTYLYVEYIEFVDDEIVLKKDTSESVSGEVKVNVFPLLANNKEVEFWSDNEDIVTVDSKGKIVGLDFGETYIHAKSKENGTKTAYCRVKVTSDKVHSISLSETQKNMYVGDTYMLSVSYVPASAIDTALDYSSSDPSVATVAQNGEVTVVGGGNVTITAWLRSNPNLSVSLRISAKPRVSKMEIESGKGGDEYSSKTSFVFPNIELSPSGASEPILYRIDGVDGQNIASVDENGAITFKKSGTVEVTAYIDGTDFAVTKKYTSTFNKFSSISFSIDSPTSIDYADYGDGKELVLKYSFAPLDMDESKLNIVVTDESGAQSEVIKLENGKLKVKRGGRATITISGEGESGVISASSTITVKRTADIIGFKGDNFEGGATFAYAGKDGITLDASSLPEDASDEIYYSLSDETVARVENGKLYFKESVISSKYGKVTVTAYTEKGVASSVVVTYIGESLEKLDINSDFDQSGAITLNAQKMGERARQFALIDDQVGDFDDLQFVLSDGQVLEQVGDSPIFTIKDKGDATITINYLKNGSIASSKTVTIRVYRLVESINNLSVKAKWDDGSDATYDDLDSVYSSASEFEILYALYPTTASTTTATISIVESSADGIAVLDGRKVNFRGIGYAKICIAVDGVSREVTIRSTFLHPDENTTLNINTSNQLEMSHDNGDSINLFDYIEMLTGANKQYITFVLEGTSVSVNNGIVFTNHGGTSKIKVYAHVGESAKKYVGEVTIKVDESAKSVSIVGEKYIYIDSKTFDIGSLFEFAPSTANIGTKLYYSVSGGANINGTRLSFNVAGKCTVTARLNGQTDGAKITIVYTGSSTVLTTKDVVIIKGTQVMLKPSASALASATYDQEFVANTSDIVVSSAFVTVNGSGKVSFGDEEFTFVCLEKNEISLSPKNASDYTYSNPKYETGLRSMELDASYSGGGNLTEYVNSGYALLTYSTSGGASVESGKISFGGAGTHSVTLTLSYAENVVGRYEKSSTIEIYTTYGVANITRKSGEALIKVFDEESPSNNIIDLTKYLNISPKPFVLDTSVLSVEIVNATPSIATVDGLNVIYTRGGAFDVKITNTTNADNVIILSFVINRSATGIKLDDTILDPVGENSVVGNRATVYVNPIAMPLDANLKRIITWEITKDEKSVAEKPSTNDRIVFSKANEEIEVTFTLESGKTFVVKYSTTDVMFEVDLEDEEIIVPIGEPFTFISSTGMLDPNKIIFTGTVDGVERRFDDNDEVYYVFTKSFNKVVNISYDSYSIERRLISISDKQTIASTDITIEDVNASGEAVSNISTTTTHTTASKSVKLNMLALDEYGADGKKLEYVLSVDNIDIATISDNIITFSKAGSVTITASITYYILPTTNFLPTSLKENNFEQKVVTYSFYIISTYGAVTDFDGVTLSYMHIYDTMENKSIDLLGGISRTAPAYGVTDSVPSVTVSGECVEWNGSKLNVVDSGIASVKVNFGTMQKDVSIKIDKYIDTISILEGVTQREITKVVTKSSEYSFKYALGGIKTPTLVDLVVSLEKDGVAQISSGIGLNNGTATLSGLETGHKYTITITAKDGGATKATKSLNIVCVAEEVNVISLNNGNNCNIVMASGEKYIFEDRYNKNIYSITNHNANISLDSIGVFRALKGDEGEITLSASGAQDIVVKYVATENVKEILLGEDTWEDNHLTAKGAREDNAGINLAKVYAPTIAPATARTSVATSDGITSLMYAIKFEVVDGNDIASIENGILYFTAQGTITIKISSTDESATNIYVTRKIKSTLGYYSSLIASVSFDGETKSSYTFNCSDGSKVPTITYTYLPSDIDLSLDKAKVNISSTSDTVFEWKDGDCVFSGGGSANLRFKWNTSSTQTKTQDVQVYILNRATNVTLTVDGKETNYIVTQYGEGEILSLGYSVTSSNGKNLSPYNIAFGSSDKNVALVDNDGKVQFKGNGKVVITIKVASEKNEEGVYDATDTIIIVNNKDSEIVSLDLEKMVSGDENENSVSKVLKVGSSKNYVVYPTSLKCYTSYTFEVLETKVSKSVSENGILSVNELGEITLKGKGGNVTIKVTASKPTGGVDTFVLNFYVWKQATISLEENNIDTAKTEWQIKPIVTNDDGSMVDKTIEYSVTKGVASVGESGLVVFGENAGGEGYAEVRVSVVYNGQEEVGETFKITTTYGKARSFKLYTLGTDDEVLNDRNVTLKTKGKLSGAFEVRNVSPQDVTVSLEIADDKSGAYEWAIENNTLRLYGKCATTQGTIQIGVSGSRKLTLNVVVIQLAESIAITRGGSAIPSGTISTFASTVELSYELDSSDVTDQSARWEITTGNNIASISVSGKVCTLTLSGADEVVLKVTSGDGEVCATATFKMTDISGFTLNTSNYTTINNSTQTKYNGYLYVGASEKDKDNVSLKINLNEEIVGFAGWGYFSYSKDGGKSWTALSVIGSGTTGTFAVPLTPYTQKPETSESFVIKYTNPNSGNTYTQNFSVYRDGISGVEFKYGNQKMDETLTQSMGLQQMLVFGNQSYYGGVQNYYNMTVETTPLTKTDNKLSGEGIVWKALKADGSVINLGITYATGTANDKGVFVGNAQIATNSLPTASVQNVYDDNFAPGEVTLTAYNLINESLFSYTFHFVSGVNVWDETGYNGTNGSLPVVLHNNIVITQRDKVNKVRTGYVNHTTIYGNDKLLDLSARNDQADENRGNPNTFKTKYEFVSIPINDAINVHINGSTQNNSIVQITSGVRYAYCEFKYLYRIMASNGEYIKRSLFTSFKYAGIILQLGNDKSGDTGCCYLEDLLMFDVGPRGIEVQFGWVNIKGFLDIYNYQNKAMATSAFTDSSFLIDLIGGSIMDMATDYKISVDGQDWVNMVGISTKGNYKKMYYWDSEKQDYIIDNTDSGDHESARGLCRIPDKTVSIYSITAWAYKGIFKEDPKTGGLAWETQYATNEDGSAQKDSSGNYVLNASAMSSKAVKLCRIPQPTTTE